MAYEALKGIDAAPMQPMKPVYLTGGGVNEWRNFRCGVGCLRTRTFGAGEVLLDYLQEDTVMASEVE